MTGGKGAGVPGVVEEEFDREFHGFDVSHVDDPDHVVPIFLCQVHLLPYAGQLIRVDPLIIPGPAHIIEMIIHAIATRSGFVSELRELAHVAPVIVAKQEGNVVGYAHPLVIIVLYFFVEGPGLGGGGRVFAGDLLDDGALVAYDLLEEGDITT